jgi:hypothetical protein
MKNFKNLFIALVIVATTASYGQTRINLYGSYTFEDSFDSYFDPGRYYQGQTQDGFQYGIGIEREIRKGTYLELSYLRLDTNAPTQYNDGSILPKFADFDVAFNWGYLSDSSSLANLRTRSHAHLVALILFRVVMPLLTVTFIGVLNGFSH